MQQRSDEALVAYLDGELDEDERRQVDAWLDADPEVRERLMALAQAGELVRGAYADIVNEPVPSRLIAAARGTAKAVQTAPQEAEILVLKRPGRAIPPPDRRWRIGLAAAAGLFGVIVGGVGTYFGMSLLNPLEPRRRAPARRGRRKLRLARQRRRLLQADRQRRRQHADRRSGQQRPPTRPCRRSARACPSRCACPI